MPVITTPTIITPTSPARFCGLCDHPYAWHDKQRNGGADKGCTGLVACKCDCSKFCDGFVPTEADGTTCFNCHQNYFEHGAVKRLIKSRLLKSDRLETACASDLAYRVFPVHLKDCCHWTIYHFMKRVEIKDLKERMSIKCVQCTPESVMTIVNIDEDVPDWAWRYPSPQTTVAYTQDPRVYD